MMENKKEVMTVKEFAQATGFTEWAVRTLIKEERIYYMKIGRKFYIHYAKTMNYWMNDPINGFARKTISLD